MNKKNKKIIAILAVVLAVVIAAMGLVYHFYGPQTKLDAPETTTAVQGETQEQKQGTTLTIEVILADGTKKAHEISTNANNLGDALTENELVEGTKGEFGLFITTVDGVKADDAKQQWWCITKGGEMVQTGADTTPIADGDKFELTLKTGYDM